MRVRRECLVRKIEMEIERERESEKYSLAALTHPLTVRSLVAGVLRGVCTLGVFSRRESSDVAEPAMYTRRSLPPLSKKLTKSFTFVHDLQNSRVTGYRP